MDYGLNTSLAAVEVPNVVLPPTTHILPPWELTPASCRAVGIAVLLVDQVLWAASYDSFAFDAKTPFVPPMAYTVSPEWPAARLARAVGSDEDAVTTPRGGRPCAGGGN